MCGIHAVFVCPQLGSGVFTVGKSVDSRSIYGQRICGIIIVTDFNGSLACGAVVSVVEFAVVDSKIGGTALGWHVRKAKLPYRSC